MNYKHKTVLLLSLLFVFLTNQAQVGSPYSQFGFGDNEARGFEQSKAMGGIGIALRNNTQLNRLNPASYSALDSLTVIYTIGINSGFNTIESSADKIMKTDTKLGYFALGFKGNQYWGSSFGLAPASRVDYTYMYSEVNDANGVINNYFHGSGGLNKVYWGNSFKINENLALGINVAYLFGSIDKVSTVVFVDDWQSAENTKVDRQLNVYDFSFNYGLQYQFDLKDKSTLILGAVYENKMNMNTKESILAGTTPNSPDLSEDYYKDIYYNDLKTVTLDTAGLKGSIALPHAFGIGFTHDYKNILLYGADIYLQKWSGVTNDVYNASYRDLISYNAGLEFTPDANNINYYFKRIHYRLGAHLTQSHLEIKNTRLIDYGVSLGFGFPVRNTKTSFNVSAEFGRRGTLEQNLLQETYGIVSLNISLSDIWFVKRKFK